MGKTGRIDTYRKIAGKWNDLKPLAEAVLITCVIAFLFYRSVFGLLTAAIIIPYWLRLKKQQKKEDERNNIAVEFKEYMMFIVSYLQTGYSLEKAVFQAQIELQQLFGNESVLLSYIHIMNQKIKMNVRLEKAFEEFAKAIDLEEAISLAEIIAFAKRSGGDYGRQIRETALKIEDNLSIKQEIITMTTEKRLELKVMSIMPIGILLYISLTSQEFIAPLYHNLLGVVLMSVCLIAYGALILLGKKIISIEV